MTDTNAQVTVLTGGRVFDGESFADNSDVVFAGNTVVGTGPGLAASHPEATVVDCTGKTVLPGIIDLHVHVTAEGAGSLHAFAEPFSLQFYASVERLQRTLAAGVTTVRDAGGADLGARVAVDQGIVSGPRMRIAVSIMSQTGGHGDGCMPSGAVSPLGITHPGRPSGVADGVEEVRKTTRKLLRAGADQIKICSTGGVLSPRDDPRHSQFTPAEIAVIVEEASAQGTYVMAHAQGTQGIKNALRAGVRSIEHGIYLDDEAIQLFLDRDAYLVPTLVAPLAVIEKAKQPNSGLTQTIIDKALLVADVHRESVAKAIAAGVKVAMGTDSGVGIHGRNLEELVQLASLGMSLEQTLRASTSVAGELVQNAEVGRLAPGYLADAVVLDGRLGSTDQLVGMQESIKQVWKDGKLAHSA
jgi:imidazolonepropionase-like amidohydrolase